MRRTLTVILASDVAGYSRLVADREEETIRRFSQASAVFFDLVKQHQGAVFNTAGDAILARFDSAVDAVRCAIDIQDANNAENAPLAEQEKLLFRIGIAIGDVLVSDDGDLLGDAVNVAARLENLAEPGGICISDDVRAHVLNKIRLNVVDLGDQSLRNIPRAIRVFKIIPDLGMVTAPVQGRKWTFVVTRPITWLASGIAVIGILGVALLAWYVDSPSHGFSSTVTGNPFDPTRIPLVTDSVREGLANYEREPDFKSIAISREGWGVAVGAIDVEFAKREALNRCRQRDDKGYCRIYAIGNEVVWSKSSLPLPADVRAVPLDTPFTPDDVGLLASAIAAQRFEAFLKAKDSKALAISQNAYWFSTNRASREEAVRLSVERCSDRFQVPCLLLSVDGFPTHKFPRSYHVTRPFTLAGEKDMSEADKERIAQIYAGKDWRALARGDSQRWYAVSGKDTEAAAVDDVLRACRETEKGCTLHAIGNFRVGKSKG